MRPRIDFDSHSMCEIGGEIEGESFVDKAGMVVWSKLRVLMSSLASMSKISKKPKKIMSIVHAVFEGKFESKNLLRATLKRSRVAPTVSARTQYSSQNLNEYSPFISRKLHRSRIKPNPLCAQNKGYWNFSKCLPQVMQAATQHQAHYRGRHPQDGQRNERHCKVQRYSSAIYMIFLPRLIKNSCTSFFSPL